MQARATAVEALLDNIYGILFFPDRTFQRLRETAPLWQAAVITIGLNALDSGRKGGFDIFWLVVAVIIGLLGWVVFAVLLRGLAFSMGRDPKLNVVLALTAFGALPWLFVAPAQALGGPLGALMGLIVLVWFAAWEVRAAAIAMELPWQRLVWVVPLTFAAGVVALIWTGGTLWAILSLG